MMAGMTVGPSRCPNCSELLKQGARFCPKCGRGTTAGAGDGVAARPSRVARREVILGWIFLVLAMVLIVPFVFGRGGGGARSWIGLGLGLALAFIAIGCLVGESSKKDGAAKS